METIQYSLNNNYNNNYNNIFSNRSIQLNKNSKKESLSYDNVYNKFDNHCVEVYGKRTCVLFYTNNEKIQIRLLDNRVYKYFDDTEIYIKIPELLEKLYTVVVVDKIKKTNSYEITAIHIPNK
jgi:hypothetical protein